MKNVLKTLWEAFIVVVICACVIKFLALPYMNQPIVVLSKSTGKCVRVESKIAGHNCSNIPEDHRERWVE